MARRKRLGLIYNYNETWIGGTYYIINLIKALNALVDSAKPLIFIFTGDAKDFEKLSKEVNYPYLKHWPFVIKSRPKRIVNKAWRHLFGGNLLDNRPKSKHIDLLFPNPNDQFYQHVSAEQKLYWIPDFQEQHLPHFFKPEEIISRKKDQEEISENSRLIVFSSEDARNDFQRLYPNSKAAKQVIKFAVTHSNTFEQVKLEELINIYSLPSKYLICPNQFWAHKNHRIVIEAIEQIVAGHKDIILLFTGKEEDYRNPLYPSSIKSLVAEKGLSHHIRFLGFIPRDHMLKLLQCSLAVVQPSLFEGWSTVIEDAKALNRFIIASDIPVHLEQLNDYPKKYFFKSTDSSDLAACILNIYTDKNTSKGGYYDYQKDIVNYGKSLIDLFSYK